MQSDKLDYFASDNDDTSYIITKDIPKDIRPVTYTRYASCVNKNK